MIKYLDRAFAVVGKLSGNPYVILIIANVCIFSALNFEESKVDITISIATLLLDLIIISQGNKTSRHNAAILNSILRSEKTTITQLDAIHNRLDNIAQRQPRDGKGRFI